MKISEFDYHLPEELIAQQPLTQRDQCRLAVLNKLNGEISHHPFTHFPHLLQAGDVLVFNNSKVLPCRIPCIKKDTGASIELFLLQPSLFGADKMLALARPRKKLQQGTQLLPQLNSASGYFQVEEIGGEDNGEVTIRFHPAAGGQVNTALMENIGLTPLPPYIHRDTLPAEGQKKTDQEFYQAIYASQAGSSAAPTAGLHFSENVLKLLRKNLIKTVEITLHVGAGTFLPVKTEELEDHVMHQEFYTIPKTVSEELNKAKKEGCRIIAVGTTSLRTLESAYINSVFKSGESTTRLFIRPGYTFKAVDGLITNFHQPRSTLLALVSAMAGREPLFNLYKDCISKRYRFLSYGDCMFVS